MVTILGRHDRRGACRQAFYPSPGHSPRDPSPILHTTSREVNAPRAPPFRASRTAGRRVTFSNSLRARVGVIRF